MNTKIRRIVSDMTIEEKAAIITGKDFWTTLPLEQLGIPSIFMTDGPHGLRKATDGLTGNTIPATCFPTASAIASSWNTELLYEIGQAIGNEAQANDVQVVLGPGVNMKRSPLAGRNFEYFSEDPYLAGTLAAHYIEGVQSTGVGTSLKHFAANNQEFERMTNDSVLDERTLHEMYLRPFEIAIAAKPWSIMASYNKINGIYAAENHTLLTETLRDRWGYEGIVISDWGAVSDIVRSIDNGLELEMPGNPHSSHKVVEAIREGWLDEETLDHVVHALLAAILQVYKTRAVSANYDPPAHHELARRAAGESIVLLRNEDSLLPLDPKKTSRIAVIGEFAKHPRYQGAGSSQVTPTELKNAYDELETVYGGSVLSYARGYRADGTTSSKLLQEAHHQTKKSDVVILFTGLPAAYESEGFDRTSIDLPEGHTKLIETLSETGVPIIVVLMNGSAVHMPWASQVRAIIEGWLTGQAGGQALVDIISGKINPSGKLSETFPLRLEDTPPFPDFPARGGRAYYREGILTGYRHYDARDIKPLFPFGFGLSYTTFSYEKIMLSRTSLHDTDQLKVIVAVKNTGKRVGHEVVQLYVTDQTEHAFHAPKDLRRFTKVTLEPGEQKEVEFTLDHRCFTYYDPMIHDWRVDPGTFVISAGGSSRDLPLRAEVTMEVPYDHLPGLTRHSLLKEFASHPRGKTFYRLIHTQVAKSFAGGSDDNAVSFISRMIDDMPLAKLGMLSNGMLTDDMVDAIITYCRHPHSLNPLYALPLLKETGKLLASQLIRNKSKGPS